MDPYSTQTGPAPNTTTNPAETQMAWMDRVQGGLWWVVAAAGVGLLVLATVIGFFDGNRPHTAAQVFGLLGYIGVEAGLTLCALLAPAWPAGARAALMIAAALLAVRTGSVTSPF